MMNRAAIRAALLVATSIAPGVAYAQSTTGHPVQLAVVAEPGNAPADTAPAPSSVAQVSDSQTSGEIIVTAQKRSERLQDVPLSITAATGDQLARRGISSPGDLEKIATGFTYRQSQNGTPVFAIRGIGFYSEQAAVAPTVTIYQDQVPLPYARMAEGAALDVERVEVLKGPQGTLFGQNSTAGAVNYIAAKPTSELAAGFNLTYGRFNQVDADAYISGPIADWAKFRLSVRNEYRDDWQVNSIHPGETIGQHKLSIGRLLLQLDPTSRLNIMLNANGWMDRSDTQQTQARGYLPVSLLPPRTPQTIATATALTDYPYVTSNNSRLTDWDPNRDYGRHDNFYQLSANIRYDLSHQVRLISISSYAYLKSFSPIDADGTYVPALVVSQHGLIKTFSQEVRLEGDFDWLKWVVGGDYERDNTNEVQYTVIRGSNTQVPFGDPFDPTTVYGSFNTDDLYNNQQVRSYAGFTSLDFKVTDKLRVQGSVRYTQEDRAFKGCVADGATGDGFGLLFYQQASPPLVRGQCVTILPDGTQGLYKTSLNEHNVSWRASVNYKPSRDTLLYGNVTKGYKSGDFGTIPALSYQQFQPVTQESVVAYELGFKTSLLDRKVDLSGAFFYDDYRNKQTQGSIVVPPFGNLPYLVNVPKSRLEGGEFDLTLRPVTGLRLTAGGTYIKTKVTGHAPVASPFGDLIDAKGEELPSAPKWQFQGDAEYTFPITSSVDAFLGAGVSWRTGTYAALGAKTGPAGTQDFFKVDGYALLDLRAGVELGNKYRIQIWGKNVTNKGYWNNVVHIYDTYGRITGQPATYGVTLSAKL
jgi:outer membrane receptor protein involved in Fe transport